MPIPSSSFRQAMPIFIIIASIDVLIFPSPFRRLRHFIDCTNIKLSTFSLSFVFPYWRVKTRIKILFSLLMPAKNSRFLSVNYSYNAWYAWLYLPLSPYDFIDADKSISIIDWDGWSSLLKPYLMKPRRYFIKSSRQYPNTIQVPVQEAWVFCTYIS